MTAASPSTATTTAPPVSRTPKTPTARESGGDSPPGRTEETVLSSSGNSEPALVPYQKRLRVLQETAREKDIPWSDDAVERMGKFLSFLNPCFPGAMSVWDEGDLRIEWKTENVGFLGIMVMQTGKFLCVTMCGDLISAIPDQQELADYPSVLKHIESKGLLGLVRASQQ